MKVAITGASGFIGNRVMEKFYLESTHDVFPLVHSYSSLALPARFNLPWRVCDHFSIEDLSRAFDGCEAVVHTAFGSPLGKMSKAVYLAADKAGVRRLVVLSSASVYNQNPLPGTTEESPLPDKPATSYNANKIASDKIFRNLRSKGKTEIVFVMPGIVFGPRSMWMQRAANQIMEGTLYLIGGGKGICNTIYVDNLVEAIRLSLTADVDGEAFFVSDSEQVTWADFYRPMLSAFGENFEDAHLIAEPPIINVTAREQIKERLSIATQAKSVQRIKPFVPPKLKKVYKTVLSLALPEQQIEPDAWAPPEEKNRPSVTLEMSLLQQSVYKLPNSKAERFLHYRPIVSFDEGMNRTIAWMEFAGYPIVS